MEIKFKNCKFRRIKISYELLKQREPEQNISHIKMPKYNQHIKFVRSKPMHFGISL